MSSCALALPFDMEVCSLGSSPVLGTSPRLGADFLSSSPRVGVDFLSSSPHFGAEFLSELRYRPASVAASPWPDPPRECTSSFRQRPRRSRVAPARQQSSERETSPESESADEAPRKDVRPILVVERRQETSAPAKDKKVIFADDKGLPLCQVRRMREPSNVPPQWSSRFLRRVTGVAPSALSEESRAWSLGFAQPAADYSRFCDRLDSSNVALEHALFKRSDNSITGTIKVKNLHFEKSVFVRVSDDNWNSSRDVTASFVPPTGASGGMPYDRFAFRLPLPERDVKVHFCVCFRSPAGEFWDNNGGRNFSASRVRVPKQRPGQVPDRDVYHAPVSDWTCFSSWGDEYGGSPYY